MRTINELLDAAKKARNLETDSALAAALGLHRAAVSTWRHGKNLPDPVAAAKLADMAGLPLAQVLGLVGELRALSHAEQAVWRRLRGAAALLALGVAFALPAPSYAAWRGCSADNLYLMSGQRRRRRRYFPGFRRIAA